MCLALHLGMHAQAIQKRAEVLLSRTCAVGCMLRQWQLGFAFIHAQHACIAAYVNAITPYLGVS